MSTIEIFVVLTYRGVFVHGGVGGMSYPYSHAQELQCQLATGYRCTWLTLSEAENLCKIICL